MKNSVHAFLSRRNVLLHVTNRFGREGHAQLSALDLPEPESTIMDGYLDLLSFLSREIDRVEGTSGEEFRSSEEARLLSTIPGGE